MKNIQNANPKHFIAVIQGPLLNSSTDDNKLNITSNKNLQQQNEIKNSERQINLKICFKELKTETSK